MHCCANIVQIGWNATVTSRTIKLCRAHIHTDSQTDRQTERQVETEKDGDSAEEEWDVFTVMSWSDSLRIDVLWKHVQLWMFSKLTQVTPPLCVCVCVRPCTLDNVNQRTAVTWRDAALWLVTAIKYHQSCIFRVRWVMPQNVLVTECA